MNITHLSVNIKHNKQENRDELPRPDISHKLLIFKTTANYALVVEPAALESSLSAELNISLIRGPSATRATTW